MAQGTSKKQGEKGVPVQDAALRRWFKSYDVRNLLFEIIRDEVARLPRREQLRVLAQIDTLREDVAETVKASG